MKCRSGQRYDRKERKCVVETMHHVELDLTDLEWNVIDQSLNAPARSHIIQGMKDLGIEASDDAIDKAWGKAQEKFRSTW